MTNTPPVRQAARGRGGRVAAGGEAQQPAMPVIGFLNPVSPDGFADRLREFRQGLKDTGYIEGENVRIEYRWAEGQIERLPALRGRSGSSSGKRHRCFRW